MNKSTLIQDTQVILFQRNVLAIMALLMLIANFLLCVAVFLIKKKLF